MAIDFKSTFRASNNNSANGNRNSERKPAAQLWLNFGYLAETIVEGEDKARFVSLPMGIPLDTMDRVSTKSSNPEFAMFQAARNDLLDQILEAASVLEPGQDYVIEAEAGLAIQIRRISAEAEAPKTDQSNPFARPKLFEVKAA